MKFEKYHFAPQVKKNIALLGFNKPTDIQYKSITPILKGDDVLAIAQTGTGKTAAFAIPIVSKLLDKKKEEAGIRCVVMVPTRELGLQISDVFRQVAKNTRISTGCIYGGVDQEPQIEMLKKGIDILVSTPGRLFDLSSQGYLKLRDIEILVLDEADHMLDLGFIKDIRDLIRFLPEKRQTLFFSATIDQQIKKLAYSLVTNPIRIEISPQDKVSRNIDHAVAYIEMDDKRFFLERMVKEHPESKILVFVRTKVRAERVCAAMERVQVQAEAMYGGKDQADRVAALRRFKSGQNKVLIATDVNARGIDIPNVDYVINYDLPEQVENYVHRVGRTGRGRERGIAISFCSEGEKELLEAIETYLTKPIEVMEIDAKDYSATVDFSDESHGDWKSLIKEEEEYQQRKRKKKKK